MRGGGRRYLTILVPVVVVVLLVVAAVLAGTRKPETYPAGSPEGAVQAYFRALADRDPHRAGALFSTTLRVSCDPTTLPDPGYPTVKRVVLDRVTTDGDHATVSVTVTEVYGSSLLGPDESTLEQTMYLVREGGEWRLADLPWPWFNCQGKG